MLGIHLLQDTLSLESAYIKEWKT